MMQLLGKTDMLKALKSLKIIGKITDLVHLLKQDVVPKQVKNAFRSCSKL